MYDMAWGSQDSGAKGRTDFLLDYFQNRIKEELMKQDATNDVIPNTTPGGVTEALPPPCRATRPVPRFDSLNKPVVLSRILPFMPTVATSALVTAICPTTMLNTHWTSTRIDN